MWATSYRNDIEAVGSSTCCTSILKVANTPESLRRLSALRTLQCAYTSEHMVDVSSRSSQHGTEVSNWTTLYLIHKER